MPSPNCFLWLFPCENCWTLLRSDPFNDPEKQRKQTKEWVQANAQTSVSTTATNIPNSAVSSTALLQAEEEPDQNDPDSAAILSLLSEAHVEREGMTIGISASSFRNQSPRITHCYCCGFANILNPDLRSVLNLSPSSTTLNYSKVVRNRTK